MHGPGAPAPLLPLFLLDLLSLAALGAQQSGGAILWPRPTGLTTATSVEAALAEADFFQI
jgi:hypothetical protein